MMNKEDMEKVVVDYLYDELPDAQRASFEASLPAFPELSDEVNAAGSLRGALRTIQPEPVPHALSQRILEIAEMHAKASEPESQSFFQKLANLVMQPAFATAFVFLIVGSTTLVLNQDDAPLSATEFAADETATPLSQPLVATKEEVRVPQKEPAAASAPTYPEFGGMPTPHTESGRTATAPNFAAAESKFTSRGKRSKESTSRRKGASKVATKGPPSLERPVDIRLADSRNSLYARKQRKRASKKKTAIGSKDLASTLIPGSARAEPRSPAPLAMGAPEQNVAAVPNKVKHTEKAPEKRQKRGLGDKRSNKRLLKAFESAMKKKQFGEARKLLGIMERRPELRSVIRAKRKLLRKQEGVKR